MLRKIRKEEEEKGDGGGALVAAPRQAQQQQPQQRQSTKVEAFRQAWSNVFAQQPKSNVTQGTLYASLARLHQAYLETIDGIERAWISQPPASGERRTRSRGGTKAAMARLYLFAWTRANPVEAVKRLLEGDSSCQTLNDAKKLVGRAEIAAFKKQLWNASRWWRIEQLVGCGDALWLAVPGSVWPLTFIQ